VTRLLQCVRNELVRRHDAATTIRRYLQIVEAFPLAKVGPRQLDPHERIFEVSLVRCPSMPASPPIDASNAPMMVGTAILSGASTRYS
jgi:hypothetical protein